MGESICMGCFQDHRKLGIAIYGHTLRRWARSSKHMLRIGSGGGAWGFISDLLDKHLEVWTIEIIDRDTNTTWTIDRATFQKHAYRRELGKGEQIICNLDHWRRVPGSGASSPRNENCANTTAPAPSTEIEQPSLFAMSGGDSYRGRRMQRRAA